MMPSHNKRAIRPGSIALLAVAMTLPACSEPDAASNGPLAPETEAATPISTADAAPAPAADSPEPRSAMAEQTFPVALRGTWRETDGPAPTAQQCRGSENGNIGKVLDIRDTSFGIFEEGGRLLAIKERADDRIRAVFDTTYADTPTRGDLTFSVDPVARTLTLVDNGGGPNSRRVYKRCPG